MKRTVLCFLVFMLVCGCEPFKRKPLNQEEFAGYFFSGAKFQKIQYVMNNAVGGYVVFAQANFGSEEGKQFMTKLPNKATYDPESKADRGWVEERIHSACYGREAPNWLYFPFSKSMPTATLKTLDDEWVYYWDETANVIYLTAVGEKIREVNPTRQR